MQRLTNSERTKIELPYIINWLNDKILDNTPQSIIELTPRDHRFLQGHNLPIMTNATVPELNELLVKIYLERLNEKDVKNEKHFSTGRPF